jgi:hypothetical protein
VGWREDRLEGSRLTAGYRGRSTCDVPRSFVEDVAEITRSRVGVWGSELVTNDVSCFSCYPSELSAWHIPNSDSCRL